MTHRILTILLITLVGVGIIAVARAATYSHPDLAAGDTVDAVCNQSTLQFSRQGDASGQLACLAYTATPLAPSATTTRTSTSTPTATSTPGAITASIAVIGTPASGAAYSAEVLTNAPGDIMVDYFVDNVFWRRENHAAYHLFGTNDQTGAPILGRIGPGSHTVWASVYVQGNTSALLAFAPQILIVEPAPATPTVTPTRTPTRTPTPTSGTPTPVPTATNTPIPGTYTTADLLYDTSGPHDGTLCYPVPATYDWGEHGRAHYGLPNPATVYVTGWGTVQWTSCGATVPNTHFYIRNARMMALVPGGWYVYPVNPANEWCANVNVATNGGYSDCLGTWDDRVMEAGQRSLHWGSFWQPFRPGTICVAVVYEARSNVAGAIMSQAGWDWVGHGDAFGGSYRRVTLDWKKMGGTNCTAAQLAAAPPPL